MRIPVLILILAIGRSASAGAQSCPLAQPNAVATPYFEFQVDTAARFIPADGVLPFPDVSLTERPPFTVNFALIQFVVDTSGVPVANSLRILLRPDGLVTDSVAAAVVNWRFQPAKLQGCRVSQLVQTPLRWK